MTWITRMSLMESADDLELNLAAATMVRSAALWNTIVFEGVDPANPWHRIWDGYEGALAAYVGGLGVSLAQRGVHVFKVIDTVMTPLKELRQEGYSYEFVAPPWLADTDVLRSHRSNLIRRGLCTAAQFKGTPLEMPMLWPFVDDEGGYQLFLSRHDKSLMSNGERKLPPKIAERVANL